MLVHQMVFTILYLHDWAILFGQMLVNIPYMEHMGSVSIPLLKSHQHTLRIINVAMDNGWEWTIYQMINMMMT